MTLTHSSGQGSPEKQPKSTPSRSRKHQAALRYADKGKPVFPCRPDKSPYTEHGFKDATTDPRRITMWWNRWPDANIGMPTGSRTRLVSLDNDVYKPGAWRPEDIERELGPLPRTATAKTGRGGSQYFYRLPEGETFRSIAENVLGPGVCVKAEGGYVVLPPSYTEGRYEWADSAAAADAPEWLLESMREKAPRDRGGGLRPPGELPEGGPIPEGTRNRSLFFLALTLKDRGKAPEEVLGELLAVNEARCAPPLGAGEVKGIARSAMRYPIRGKPADPRAQEVLEEAWRQFYEEVLPGGGRSKKRDSYRVLLEFGERFGDFIEVIVDGEVRRAVAVSLSYRQGAIPAATSHMSFARAMKALEDEGRVVRGSVATGAERPDEESETWLILEPATKCYTPAPHTHAGGVTPCRAPQETPCFRWRNPVGNSRGGTLVAVEMYPGSSAEELAGIMGYARVRDFQRKHLQTLMERGDVVERDSRYYTPENYRERMEAERNTPYPAWKRRRTSVDPSGMVTHHVEYGPEMSDVERDERDRERYERQREKFREALRRRWRDPAPDTSNSPEEMLPVARNLFPLEDGYISKVNTEEDGHPPGCGCPECYYTDLKEAS